MLGLKVATDGAWAIAALSDLDGLLSDHAHCEVKAASNALALAARCAGDVRLAGALAELAGEEIEHYRQVLAVLAARDLSPGPPAVDEYAVRLRRAAGLLPRAAGPGWLVDRLLVAALIEARSCERFKLLARAAAGAGLGDLEALWTALVAGEARHYRTLIDLAVHTNGSDDAKTTERLERLADAEAAIVSSLALRQGALRLTIHG